MGGGGGLAGILAALLGGGKGKGKGKSFMPRDKSKVVWVGGLSGEVTWQELQEHFNQAGKTSWVEVHGKEKSAGCVGFKTEEEAANAISTLNGSSLKAQTLQVGTWEKKEKE